MSRPTIASSSTGTERHGFDRSAGIVLAAVCLSFQTWAAGQTDVKATRQPSSTNKATSVALDYDPSRGRVWLSANLNGLGPHSFLLDTGYDLTMIHPDLAERLQLNTAGQVWIVGIAGRERATYYQGARLEFKGLDYAPRRVAALPSERDRRRQRDGILGSDFFRRFVVEVDPRDKQVRLHEPEHYTYSGPGEAMAFRFEGDTPVIEASISDADRSPVKARFEIDTGCEGGLCLGREFVEANDWLLSEGQTREGFRRGVGGGARTTEGRVPRLHLGKSLVEKSSAQFFTEGSPAGPGMAGHVGWEALRDFKVVFDYSRSRIILEQ